MDYLDLPINKAQQYAKIIEDTEEIIKNFRALSELIVSKNDEKEETMYTLGKKIIHSRQEFLDPSANLGNTQVNLI